jgi:tetratricopeptide (TPR) repeat protein
MIHGPGGIGKSTLLAAFVLQHVEGGAGSRFPFAYLDFDRSDLTAEEPATLLVEAVRQLGFQYPEVEEQSRKVSEHWRRELSGAQADPWLQSSSFRSDKSVQSSLFDRRPLLADLQKIVDQVGQERPFLLILDTFEVVQHRSRDWVAELWNVLNELQERVPRLRTVISGRAPVRAFRSREMRLGDLERDAAECLLQAQGVKNPDLARRLARQVGGSPLSLELAAEIVRTEGIGDEGITDLTVWRRLQLQIQENGIQGYLYRRLLSRIRDRDVRELAHPGLILRRVTPELIKDVLAEPCGIALTEGQEYDLFDKLSQEVTLVTFETDGSLRHRADVRRIMLDSLTHDEPLKVRQIHERAADYYQQRNTAQDRAEEIYHRLFLEEDPAELDPLWEPGVEQHLLGAVDEVPQRSRSYLASHIGVTRDDLEWNALEIEEWERLAEERVRQLMVYNSFEEALEVLAERDERSPGSTLYLLEATVLAELERWPEARRAVKQGLYWAKDDDPVRMLDLLRLSARIDEQTGQLAQARQMWQQALDLISDPEFPRDEAFSDDPLDDTLVRLEIALGLLRLADVDPRLDGDEVEALQAQAMGLFDAVATILPQINWQLFREAALQLGTDNPLLLSRALASAEGLAVEPGQWEKLGAAMASWDRQMSRKLGADPGVLAEEAGVQVADGLEAAWTKYLHTIGPGYLSRLLSRLLEKHPVPRSVASVMVDLLLPEERHAPEAALR